MYNVKPEALTVDIDKTKIKALTGDINKAKIKAVTGDNGEDPYVREVVLNYMNYYIAFFETVYAD